MPDRYFLLIPHPSESKVLLLGENNKSLPYLDVTNGFIAYVGQLVQDIHERLGMTIAILRCIHYRKLPHEAQEVAHAVFACDNLGGTVASSTPHCWADKEAVEALADFDLNHREVLRVWFTEAIDTSRISPLRPEWAHPGWFSEADRWIRDALSSHGIEPTAPLEQLKTWSISCVLRLSTTAGTVYYKAVPTLFAAEPRLTDALARRFPDLMPEVIARNEEQDGLLLREIRGVSLRDLVRVDPETGWFVEALRRFARLQVACISQTDEWIRCGCRLRSLRDLPAAIDELLSEAEDAGMRAVYGLTDVEDASFQTIATYVTVLVDQLIAFGLPETLVHGDLHPGNIQIVDDTTERRCVFFDWSDGAISHPFFDLITFLDDLDRKTDEEVFRYAHRRDAYLEAWTTFLPRESLQEAFAVAQRLAPAYHAVSYACIARATEPSARWELASAVGGYLKQMISR